MRIKWVQLDLARQMLTMTAIEQFIRIMAKAGYNGILLYLEDRIRTVSYPYPEDGECYTVEQIEYLVGVAGECKIELIPCVATLGHAERFLRHPELQHLSEIQGDMCDRFGDSLHNVFCPTHPDFYPFMETYLREVAALFPGSYFHAGLDEFFSFCSCPRCKEAAPDTAGESALFVRHISRIHATLSGLGKRMVMWSDMFEIYKDALKEVPRDILMIDWQYQNDVRFYLSHLLDCEVEDRFGIYEKLGMECAVAPSDMQFGNVVSCLKFARGEQSCIGFVQTGWEKTDAYLFRYLPVYVFTGLVLSGKSFDDAFRSMQKILFDSSDPDLSAILRLIYSNGFWRHFESISENTLFFRDFYGMPYSVQEIDISGYEMLQRQMTKPLSDSGKHILQDILNAVHEKVISHQLKRLYHDALDGHAVDLPAISALHEEYLSLIRSLSEKWNQYRSGIFPNVFEEKIPKLREQLHGQVERLQHSSFLKLRICLPDGYGAQYIRIRLRCCGEWREISNRILKPNSLNTSLAEIFIPCSGEFLQSDAVMLESYGLGGVGICWLELGEKHPVNIVSVNGIVEHPEYLLENDVKFAWFGSQSSRADYCEPQRMSVVHKVILSLSSHDV